MTERRISPPSRSKPDEPSGPILITGAAGFIGSRYVEYCNKAGIPVVSVDDPKHFQARGEHHGLDFGQVVNRDLLEGWLMSGQGLRAVVHLGACTDTTELDEDYLKKMNLEYSQMLWDYCSKKHVPLVYASSAATYGAGEFGYGDDEGLIPRLRPLNPYGESKRLFDLWVLDQERNGVHPPSWSGFKFFNVYGYGERHKGKMASVVLHAFDQIRARGSVRLFRSHRQDIADGHQKRDFIYVEDVVDVLEFARCKPIRRGIFNLGTGEARTFLDLVRATFAASEAPESIEFIDTPVELRERYQYFTQADVTRLRAEGYTKLFTPLEKGVKSYIDRLKKD